MWPKILLLIGGLIVAFGQGIDLPDLPSQQPTDTWQVFADLVDVQSQGAEPKIADTDMVLKIARNLVEMEALQDISRLDEFLLENKPITDSNRAEVIKNIREE